VTWDSGSVDGERFTKRYSSDYLFTPPDVFGHNHFPEKPADQLREVTISRGEFMRQPNLSPAFFAGGWKLVSPNRSQVTVDTKELHVQVERTSSRFLTVSFRGGQRCETKIDSNSVDARCTIPGPGNYDLILFDGPAQYGTTHWSVGQISVLAR
jgi:hypothetical protein